MSPRIFKALTLAALIYIPVTARADVTVFAAASLTNALTEIARNFEAERKTPVKLSFASSSALAKQIEQGAPADLFLSADSQWMDYLDGKGKIDHDSRLNLVGNALVLIAPRKHGFPVVMKTAFDFSHAFEGKLCTGVVESVPVGIYAKEALTRLGWWKDLQYRIVGSDNVRAALNLVEQGECATGIVYATDAKQSGKVEIIGRFPEDTHAPIVYPAALVTQSGDAVAFLDYLKEEPASAIFAKYGFEVLNRHP